MNRTRKTASIPVKCGLIASALLISGHSAAAEDIDTFGDYSPALQFQFYDNSTYGQVSRIRYLRLFTFADSGKSRWFLGVDSDGIVGLHYRATSRYRPDDSSDLLRLPYLDSHPTLDIY